MLKKIIFKLNSKKNCQKKEQALHVMQVVTGYI